MINWKNLDTLAAFGKLVDVARVAVARATPAIPFARRGNGNLHAVAARARARRVFVDVLLADAGGSGRTRPSAAARRVTG